MKAGILRFIHRIRNSTVFFSRQPIHASAKQKRQQHLYDRHFCCSKTNFVGKPFANQGTENAFQTPRLLSSCISKN
jgi:hypothetical protein